MRQLRDNGEARQRRRRLIAMLRVTPRIRIPESDLSERFVRAGGPGGQNVDKTATAVQLRFRVTQTNSLPEPVRTRLLTQAAGHINRDGELMIDARGYRDQQRNREDARERLAGWVARAAQTPTRRRPTRPSRAAKARRVAGKKHRGRTKQLRNRPRRDD